MARAKNASDSTQLSAELLNTLDITPGIVPTHDSQIYFQP